MNTPCSIALLESALAGNLRTEDETALHQHLEECPQCGAALEQMAGGPAWCREAASLLASDELDTALPGHSLAGYPLAGRDEWSEIDFTVEHLEPADEPGVLGRLGSYDVLEIIGRGGMGVVLKGYDRELKRCVAIKVLSPHLAQSSLARKRFAREAQAAAAVVHPNVLAIHQVQPNGRLPFLVMPLVAGESLAQRLTAQGRLELKEILRIGMQAAAGLAAAHEQGLVHRDVKPANILLEKGVERAVLTDFGLARAADDVTLTRWGVIAGTPQYMSPEQARGEALDCRSDLFSLGCVLYEMATGVSPFRTESVMATMRRLVEESPQSLASLNAELPPWFIAIVDRLLEKDPARRFNTAKEVSELLEGCLAHLQQPASVPLPAALPNPARKVAGTLRVPSAPFSAIVRFKGVLAMVSTIGIVCLGMFMVSTNPPDISGEWTGEDWGRVVLKKTDDTDYTGSFSDTISKQPGEIQLKWSRIERRFNGAWREGEDRFGDLSIRLVGDDIRGALTTDVKSKINPATPRLADLTWIRERTLPTSKPSGPVSEGVLIKSFDTTAKLITKDEITVDQGAWRIEAKGNRTVRLFEVPELAVEDCRVIYRAKLKSEKLQGQAYMEMWCRLPGGEYFSKGLQSPLTGTTDWASYETPFFLKKGERTDLIKLNVVIEGKGTLWIKDVELIRAPLEPVRNVDNIDLPFVNDPDVLGEWKSVDFVAAPSEFNPDKTNWKGDLYLKGLTFLPGGKTPWPWSTWTKGVLMHHGDKTASHYQVTEIEGQRYMFLEWKSGDVTILGLKPKYYVLRWSGIVNKVEDMDSSAKVEKAVKTISTCAEGDPRVAVAIASLKGLNEARVVADLAKFLDSQEATVRRSAIYVLWQGKFASIEPAVAGLLKQCENTEDLTRGMAALALGGNRIATSLAVLIKMTADDKSGYARRCGAIALGFLGDPAATTVLQKALKDPEFLVRANALAALAMLRKKGAENALSRPIAGPAIERVSVDGNKMAPVSRTFPLRFKLASAMVDDLRQILLGRPGQEAKPSANNREITITAPPEAMKRVQTFITVTDWPDNITRRSNFEYPRESVLHAARSFFYACAIEDTDEVFSKLLSLQVLAELKGDTKSEHYETYVTGGVPDPEWEKSLRADWPGKKEAIQRLVCQWNRYPLTRITEESGVAIGFGVKHFCSVSFDGAPKDFYTITIEPGRTQRDGGKDSYFFSSLPPWWNMSEASSNTGIAPAATKATYSLASNASAVPVFQLRLVVDAPSEQSEPMVLVETSKEPARKQTLYVQKKVLLDQAALKSARAHADESTGGFRIDIAFTNQGKKRFAEITRDNLGKRLAIIIGGKLCSAPKIMSEIPGGQAQISGTFSEQEARALAAKISEAIATATELERLQGKWEGVEVGREATGQCTLEVSGTSIHFQGSNKHEWYKGDFLLNLETDPKQLKAMIRDCPLPDYRSKCCCAIYKLEDGKLTLVGHPPGVEKSPESFAGDATSRTFVFRKIRP